MDILRSNRNLLLIEGIVFIAFGLLAIAAPMISTLATELFIGWLLLIGGLFQGYRTLKAWAAHGFWTSLLSSILNIVLGILLVAFPIAGMISLTLLLTFFFILQGITQIAFAFQLKAVSGWVWLLLNGIIALILAFIIYAGWPQTAFWVIGTLLGINMLFFGIALFFLYFGLSKN